MAKPLANQQTTSAAVTHRAKDGTETTVKENVNIQRLAFEDGPGMVGLSTGLTIPGPKGSYTTARVDVSVYLPCANNEASVRKVLATCHSIVEGEIERASAEVQEFFNSPGTKQG